MLKKVTVSKAAGGKYPLAGRRFRHRVMVAGRFVFGPGKADVLEAIQETGSLAAAARSLGMSYMRAWRLIQEMRQTYKEPFIEVRRGGKANGGATLTQAGEKALLLYRRMELEALKATRQDWMEFRRLLKPSLRGKTK